MTWEIKMKNLVLLNKVLLLIESLLFLTGVFFCLLNIEKWQSFGVHGPWVNLDAVSGSITLVFVCALPLILHLICLKIFGSPKKLG